MDGGRGKGEAAAAASSAASSKGTEAVAVLSAACLPVCCVCRIEPCCGQAARTFEGPCVTMSLLPPERGGFHARGQLQCHHHQEHDRPGAAEQREWQEAGLEMSTNPPPSATPQVIARLELTHVPLYGLQYTDHKDYQTFLKPDKKVRSQRERERKKVRKNG